MCSYDTKTAHYCQENEDGQDVNSLICYIQGLDYTRKLLNFHFSLFLLVKNQRNAESFLKCFKALHENEINTDEQGRIHIEGSFESSQDSNGLTDSQNSQTSNSSQKTIKRYAPPATTLSSIKSMQSASSLLSDKLKSAPKENSLDNKPNEEPTSNMTNSLANGLQELLPGLTNSNNSDVQPFPELDIKQFVTGLLLSTMNTVNNAQVSHFLCL